jgi:hypothetical protein
VIGVGETSAAAPGAEAPQAGKPVRRRDARQCRRGAARRVDTLPTGSSTEPTAARDA